MSGISFVQNPRWTPLTVICTGLLRSGTGANARRTLQVRLRLSPVPEHQDPGTSQPFETPISGSGSLSRSGSGGRTNLARPGECKNAQHTPGYASAFCTHQSIEIRAHLNRSRRPSRVRSPCGYSERRRSPSSCHPERASRRIAPLTPPTSPQSWERLRSAGDVRCAMASPPPSPSPSPLQRGPIPSQGSGSGRRRGAIAADADAGHRIGNGIGIGIDPRESHPDAALLSPDRCPLHRRLRW